MKKPPAIEPWHPAPYDDWDHYAMRALGEGKASEGQQKTALKWIIEVLCQTYQPSYRSASDRDTAFAEGKRHVGLQLVKHITTALGKPK